MNKTNDETAEKIAELNEVYEELAQGSVHMSEAILDVGENLLETEKVYNFITRLALLATAFSGLVMTILSVGSVLSQSWLPYLSESILIFCLFLAITMTLHHFGEAFYDLYAIMSLAHNLFYKTLLETTSPEGKTPRERILSILKRLYVGYPDYLSRNPDFVRMDYKTLSGYSFDIYLHEKQNLLNKFTHRFGEPGLDVFVKRFDGIVSLEDLKNLHTALLEIYNRQSRIGRKVFDMVIALSPEGFTSEAIEYAKRGESWIPEIRIGKEAVTASPKEYFKKVEELKIEYICGIDLIKESRKGYRLVWSYEWPPDVS